MLCNVLAQNPELSVSDTSPLPGVLGTTLHALSNSSEIVSELAQRREQTERRIEQAARYLVHGWYTAIDRHIIDKSRVWGTNFLALRSIFPESLIIVTVRDLRAVMGSIEKQHLRFPLLDTAAAPEGKTLFQRASEMFAPTGMVGKSVVGVEDLLRRNPKRCLFVDYRAFCLDPNLVLDRVYAELPVDRFEHDLDNVERAESDLDALYLNKFPHEGCGKVEAREDDWQHYVSADVAQLIVERYPFYCKRFGYV